MFRLTGISLLIVWLALYAGLGSESFWIHAMLVAGLAFLLCGALIPRRHSTQRVLASPP
jgi:hypothetical protein